MLHGRRQLVLLRCMVNSENERNPLIYLLLFLPLLVLTCTILVLPPKGGGRWGEQDGGGHYRKDLTSLYPAARDSRGDLQQWQDATILT